MRCPYTSVYRWAISFQSYSPRMSASAFMPRRFRSVSFISAWCSVAVRESRSSTSQNQPFALDPVSTTKSRGPAASGGDHWNSRRHRLDVDLAKRFVVGGCNQNVGEVESSRKNIVGQPPAEKHVRQVEGAGHRMRMLAFPFTGHPSPDEQVERGMMVAVERLVDSRDGREQQRNAFEIEKATHEYQKRLQIA